MPIYDFKCNKCNKVYELRCMRYADSINAKCEICTSKLERLFTLGHAKRSGEADWATGMWPDIDFNPTYIKNKQHLKEVLDKKKFTTPGLAKPKSSGKGWENAIPKV